MPTALNVVAALVDSIEGAGPPADLLGRRADDPEVVAAYREAARRAAAAAGPYPEGRFAGRGIVIGAGGERYFPCAWVAIRMLRHLGCTLPIQLWHLGPDELTPAMAALVRPLGVEPVDAWEVRRDHPCRILNGWELKCFAILHSPFREVLLLDSDNVAVLDPTYLFDCPEHVAAGATLWPDYCRHEPWRKSWGIFDVPYRDEPEVESGQVLVDKRACWEALNLAMHYNEHSDYYYEHVWGDKETFHFAFRRLEAPYAMPDRGIDGLDACMCQHDFAGTRVFQHRNMDKWRLDGTNKRIFGFDREETCRQFLRELRALRSDEPDPAPTPDPALAALVPAELALAPLGGPPRSVTLLPDGRVEGGDAGFERSWSVRTLDGAPALSILGPSGVACLLTRSGDAWVGPWLGPT